MRVKLAPVISATVTAVGQFKQAGDNYSGNFQMFFNMIALITIAAALGACGSQDAAAPKPAVSSAPAASLKRQQPGRETLSLRMLVLDAAVRRWQAASTIAAAHKAAEEARNLIVGSHGPFYGDADRDGTIGGASALGVLPGLRGEPSLALSDDNTCVVNDILGGSWGEPRQRWSRLQSAISRWSSARNTFPTLPSHAQRVVGWATLTLNSNSLDQAHEYARHARLHVDVSMRAVNSCRR